MTQPLKLASLFACSVYLTGCASLLEGTSQEIQVSTNPSGASCNFEREGQSISSIQSTPATVMVRRRKYDILIKCNKPGFQEATFINHSGLASGSVAGNVAADLLLTAGLSSIVDSASGADNQYDSVVNMTLVPNEPTAPSATPPKPVK